MLPSERVALYHHLQQASFIFLQKQANCNDASVLKNNFYKKEALNLINEQSLDS
jgi:hypothetical protein